MQKLSTRGSPEHDYLEFISMPGHATVETLAESFYNTSEQDWKVKNYWDRKLVRAGQVNGSNIVFRRQTLALDCWPNTMILKGKPWNVWISKLHDTRRTATGASSITAFVHSKLVRLLNRYETKRSTGRDKGDCLQEGPVLIRAKRLALSLDKKRRFKAFGCLNLKPTKRTAKRSNNF